MNARIRITAALIALSLAAASVAFAQQGDKLGKVQFQNSCSPAVQEKFLRGVAMLHSFYYSAAQKAFEEVAAEDNSCAIAAWGYASILMSNPLQGIGASLKSAELAQTAINKGRNMGAKAQREREYLEAVAAYYEDFANRPERARQLARAKAYEALAAKYPDDDEAQIFYALYLAGTQTASDQTYSAYLKAAGILEKQFAKHPDHPGVAHYLIHSYDAPPIAAQGLPAARRYAVIAPDAPHALHMPSHVYSTLGMWREAIGSDSAADDETIAYTARVNPKAATEPAKDPSRYHFLDFLTNAYLQLGEDQQAKRIVDARNSVAEYPAGFRYSGHTAFAAIPVRYAFERSAWGEAAALAVPKTPFAQAEAITWFGRAVGAARSGELTKAKEAIDHIRVLKDRLAQANDAYWTGQVAIQEYAAAAWLTLGEGRKADAIAAMRQAADLEDRSGKHVAMENRLSPIREMFGELLLEAGEPAQALREFEASLLNNPNRYRSFAGAAKAAERIGNRAQAKSYYEKLVALTGNVGTARPDLAAAKQYLARK